MANAIVHWPVSQKAYPWDQCLDRAPAFLCKKFIHLWSSEGGGPLLGFTRKFNRGVAITPSCKQNQRETEPLERFPSNQRLFSPEPKHKRCHLLKTVAVISSEVSDTPELNLAARNSRDHVTEACDSYFFIVWCICGCALDISTMLPIECFEWPTSPFVVGRALRRQDIGLAGAAVTASLVPQC